MSTERHICLEILTPEGPLLEADGIRWVRAQLEDGLIGILPDHAPLLAELVSGALSYADGAGVHDVAVAGGILWIHSGGVRILTGGDPEEGSPQLESDLTRRLDKLEEPISDLLSRELGIVEEDAPEDSA